MTFLAIDIGNTRLKCAPLHADGGIGETLAIAHGEGDDWLEDLPFGTVACIASVAAHASPVWPPPMMMLW